MGQGHEESLCALEVPVDQVDVVEGVLLEDEGEVDVPVGLQAGTEDCECVGALAEFEEGGRG